MAYEPKEAPAGIPYEAIPQLATNPEFVEKMERMRQLKRALDEIEPEFDALKLELGAMIAVTGEPSVAYIDLRVTNASGGTVKGKLTGKGIEAAAAGQLSAAHYRAIALAAKDCDESVLLENGLPAILIAQGRSEGTVRAGSTRIEWVGGKGKGGKRRAEGSGGPVQ